LLFAIDAASIRRGKQHVSGPHFGHRTLPRFSGLIVPTVGMLDRTFLRHAARLACIPAGVRLRFR
jgi:hypothetical protein